jgi:predicted RNA-binding Zn ribbon-like protein
MDMTSAQTDATSALFLGDHLALDFLNTQFVTAGRKIDCIDTPAKLSAWLMDARARHAASFAAADTEPDTHEPTEDAVTRARSLREWLRELLLQRAQRRRVALRTGDVRLLNDILAAGQRRRQVVADRGKVVLKEWVRYDNPESVLHPIAEAIARLLCEDDLKLVRKCDNDACVLWFYDRTKSKRRRWCSMAFCGNHAKVNAFRRRQKRQGGSRARKDKHHG